MAALTGDFLIKVTTKAALTVFEKSITLIELKMLTCRRHYTYQVFNIKYT